MSHGSTHPMRSGEATLAEAMPLKAIPVQAFGML
jgi:hypothetical protein